MRTKDTTFLGWKNEFFYIYIYIKYVNPIFLWKND